ncbi:MAG TPA: acyl--CoA ligase family protein [Candidatus Acidoferrales bacterium]|nr:acyl--CoA ligase family protein [Candidatus Acidoferrales bacterium]
MLPVNRTELTPLLLIERAARVYACRIGVVYGQRRLTYGELGTRVRRLATALQRAGIRRGDRVAFLAPNVPALLEAHFGVALAGATLVAINTRLNAEEINYILEHSGARLLFVDAELALPLTPKSLPRTVEQVITIDDREFAANQRRVFDGPEYEAFIDVAPDAALAFRVPHEDDVYSINYTSGTTGRPKGVMYTHRSAYLNALSEIIAHRLDPSSVYLWTLPMFHCNGWCFPWAVTGAGGTHLLLRRIDPPAVWQLIRREGVTHFNGAPTVLIMLINDPAAPAEPLRRPLRIATGGAPPSPTLLAQWERVGAEITHLYGLTETYGPHTYCDWQPEWNALNADERAQRRARQGVASLVACEVRVVDEQMHDVLADGATMGEVVMRGNNVMQGYFAQPDATAEAFRGEWFHSGDVAVMHPDGYIELRDRKKDIIISGGENISTIEIEQAIARHPDVLEVAVIAVPDDKWGEVPKAFVTPKDGHHPTEMDIIAHCRAQLAHFKCPKSVEIGPLPKTSTGKVQKFVLRERAWAGHDKRIH